ncbi:hypothetical protein [Azospirillum brasilense]|uniref:hypothetical protein n=1 Tax=Azospirillum brasilense TaxID=192 RepID=UPI001EDA9A7F|nr:hypothetical protein [Azospirillum brasilense]UKJ74471.1 hypothetical protein H1Q64_18080 [Azospirillum brasilense]
MTTASDLRAINGDVYNPSTNAGGLDGPGGMEANFPKALGLIAQGLDDMAVYLSQANYLAAQASVATILQLCQALVAQITMGSTTALAFPSVDKVLLSTANVVQTFVYDTRRDDRLPDGTRWNEPGRCSHLSYWHETQGTYTGVKRDVPAVVAISALKEQWYLHDALDLDPVTGVPRLWRASNPTGNGLVLCGSSAPITCVFALNGYMYFGTGMGLHVVSLTGDWCERYDNGGRRRRLGTFAQRNTVLSEGGVIASAALPATAINSVHARVYPGAPLDAAGLPIPTVAVACGAGGTVAVIHPNGTVATATGLSNCASVYLTERATVMCEQLGFDAVEVALPYSTGTPTVVQRFGAYRTTYGGLPINFSANAAYIMGDGAIGGRNGGGVTFLAKDYGNDASGMVAYVTPGYATGWMPGDIRLATLCDAATGSITGSGELITNGDFAGGTAGWTAVNGASLSVISGRLRCMSSGTANAGAYQVLPTVAGRTYLLRIDVDASGYAGAVASVQVRQDGYLGLLLAESYVSAGGVSGRLVQFTATSMTTAVWVFVQQSAAGAYVEFDNISCNLAAPDRSYKGKGLIVNGTLQRNPVATGADVVAWSGFLASNYLQRPHDADMPFGAGDFYVSFWCKGATTGTTILSTAAPDGSGAALRVISTTNGPDAAFSNSLGGWGGEVFGGTRLDGSDFVKVDILRRNGVVEVWTNGVLGGSGTNTTDLTNAAGALTVGKEPVGGFSTDGTLALLRMGGLRPHPRANPPHVRRRGAAVPGRGQVPAGRRKLRCVLTGPRPADGPAGCRHWRRCVGLFEAAQGVLLRRSRLGGHLVRHRAVGRLAGRFAADRHGG